MFAGSRGHGPYNQVGGSKPFPGRKHSIAPRFGYQQLTGLLDLRVAPYEFAYKKSPAIEQGFDMFIWKLLKKISFRTSNR